MSSEIEKHVIVTAMRDEAANLIEWLAHHFVVGFDEIYVYTNDCRDRTKEILVTLGQEFPIYHFDNEPPYEAATIQAEALRLARGNKRVSAADWVMHIDADEYVNVTVGDRKIADLTALYPEADAVAIAWKFFGNGGLLRWDPTIRSLRQFTLCELAPELDRVAFKTIFRPSRFKLYSVHSPKLPHDADTLKVVNTAGQPMPIAKMLTERGSRGIRLTRSASQAGIMPACITITSALTNCSAQSTRAVMPVGAGITSAGSAAITISAPIGMRLTTSTSCIMPRKPSV